MDPVYTVVYLDAVVVKIRDKGVVQNRSVYLSVGIGPDGHRDVLGMWIQANEGAKFRLTLLTELRQRGVRDIFILCADLRRVYASETVESALIALDKFEEKWSKQYPTIAPAWRGRWHEIAPFLDFPAEIRRTVDTTNAIEGLNRILRKLLKTRGQLPSDDAFVPLDSQRRENMGAKERRVAQAAAAICDSISRSHRSVVHRMTFFSGNA